MEKTVLPNEQAAEWVTHIVGWVCKTCRRFYGSEEGAERTARYCCEKDHACGTTGCPHRAEKPWIYCPACNAKTDEQRYLKLPEVDWDGETPLVVFDDDRYFFDIDTLRDWMDEDGLKIEQVRLVIAERDQPRHFDVNEFLSDYLGDEGEFEVDGADQLDKIVNEWIEKHAPTMWTAGTKRPSLKSLTEALEIIEG